MINIFQVAKCDGCGMEQVVVEDCLLQPRMLIPQASPPLNWLELHGLIFCEDCRKPVDEVIKKLKEKSDKLRNNDVH